MVGLIRPSVPGLVLIAVVWLSAPCWADDGPDAPKLDETQAEASAAAVLGEPVPEPFVPLHPRTAEDRDRIEVLNAYVTARALEEQKRLKDAIDILQRTLEKSPDSVAILRRLSGLNFALGQVDQGVDYAKKVIEVEPGDTTTLNRLMIYYLRRNDANGAEALLRKVLENPKLDENSAGFLVTERYLGELYANQFDQPEKAAESFAKVLDALDQKAANALSPLDQTMILGEDEAASYTRFGEVFLQARRYDLAVRAFRHAMVYAPDNAQLQLLLAETLRKDKKPQDALKVLEPYLKRQPQGREPYDLLTQILQDLNRPEEIIPRLEAAAKADSKNLPLQYLLADHYREAGQPEKAEVLYKTLREQQPDPQGLGGLTATLLQEKKYEELIKILGEAFTKPETLESVKPQIERIVNNPTTAEEVLDAGLKLQDAEPPQLSRESLQILTYIATKSRKLEKLIPIKRSALRSNPNPQGYRELWLDLYRNGKYGDSADILDEMIQKYPAEKDPQILVALANSRMLAGQNDAAMDAAKEAIKLNPNDAEAMRLVGFILGREGKNEEAIAHFQRMLERFPNDDDVYRKAHLGLSDIYTNLEQFDKAEAELELLLEREPDDPFVNNNLGYLLADRGKDLERAEQLIRRALEMEPDNTAYLDSLGWVLFKLGKPEKAVEPLEKAAEDSEADATIHDHLGDVYFKLKKLDKAREAWKRAESIAAKANPPDKRLPEIRKKLQTLDELGNDLPATDDQPKP